MAAIQWQYNVQRSPQTRAQEGVGAAVGAKQWDTNTTQTTGVDYLDRPVADTTRTVAGRHIAANAARGVIASVSMVSTVSTEADATYPAVQIATTGGGIGATFSIDVLSSVASLDSITAAGTGYAVGEVITLDIGGNPSVQVDTLV